MSAPVPAAGVTGACDCHIHIYEEGAPLASGATFKPPHAPLSAYRTVQRTLGLQRVVLVQPTGYGFDNAILLAALAELGSARARAVVVVPPQVRDVELEELHAAGVRGIRYMMLAPGGGLLPWDTLETMAARIAPLGWHINLQLDGRELPRYIDRLERLPCKLVIDHIGKFLAPVLPENPCFQALLRVLGREGRWVKLAAPYETSRLGPPGYDDVGLLAKALVQSLPQHCLWATNWPHPNRQAPPRDADLLNLLSHWAPEAGVRDRILVDNPAQVYGFGAPGNG